MNQKLSNLDALYKNDSERLTELSRLDKQVERISNKFVNMVNKMDTFDQCIDKLTHRISYTIG